MPNAGAGGSVVVRRSLGRQLRQLRIKAGKTVEDLVEAGVGSKVKVWRIEAGKGPVKMGDVRQWCWVVGADQATTDALAGLAAGTQQDDWWEPYAGVVVPDWFGLLVGLRETASRIAVFEPMFVHGLLQTEDYARAVIGSDETLAPDAVEQRVRFRLDHQRRVLGRGPEFAIVLGAGALSQVVGSAEIMAAQIDHLRRLDRDATAIRVLPFTAGAYPVTSRFELLQFNDHYDPSVVYVEFSGGARYVEQADQVARYEHVFDLLMSRTVPIEEWRA